MDIRLFHPQDAGQIAQLFHDTVREINQRDYSFDQIQAWAPDEIYFRNWAEMCSKRSTFVAAQSGLIVGFGELEPDGHIDCFYCHKNYQGRGIGRQIYQTIEAKALNLGLTRLFVEASITAKPFFQHMGFSVVQQQQVFCRGETFINYLMDKQLLI